MNQPQQAPQNDKNKLLDLESYLRKCVKKRNSLESENTSLRADLVKLRDQDAKSWKEGFQNGQGALEVIQADLVKTKAKADGMHVLLNTPEIHDFHKAITLEAAHQRKRWGIKHDEGKSADEWLWLVAFLATKATQADRYGDRKKYLHHIITAAAACCNWHANVMGQNTEMRPGVDPNRYATDPEGKED